MPKMKNRSRWFAPKIFDRTNKPQRTGFRKHSKMLITIVILGGILLSSITHMPYLANTVTNILYIVIVSVLFIISLYVFRTQNYRFVLESLIIFTTFNLIGYCVWAFHEMVLKIPSYAKKIPGGFKDELRYID